MSNKIQKSAEDVIGTPWGINITSSMSTEECREFDTYATMCEECGWWVEADDVNEDHICSDCTYNVDTRTMI